MEQQTTEEIQHLQNCIDQKLEATGKRIESLRNDMEKQIRALKENCGKLSNVSACIKEFAAMGEPITEDKRQWIQKELDSF
jgi:peptidoglycan hydrolase CwlO-like protein